MRRYWLGGEVMIEGEDDREQTALGLIVMRLFGLGVRPFVIGRTPRVPSPQLQI